MEMDFLMISFILVDLLTLVAFYFRLGTVERGQQDIRSELQCVLSDCRIRNDSAEKYVSWHSTHGERRVQT